MSITNHEARRLLQDSGLRVTAPRLAVLRVLASSEDPLSHTEVLDRLGDTSWDPTTIYRNLIKLRGIGLAPVVSRAGGVDRYGLAPKEGAGHRHPHFVCDECGRVMCLPAELTASMTMEGPWAASIRTAIVELRGQCPDCRARSQELHHASAAY